MENKALAELPEQKYMYEIEVRQSIATVVERRSMLEALIGLVTLGLLFFESIILSEFIAQDSNLGTGLIIVTTTCMNLLNVVLVLSVHLKWASNYFVLRPGEVVFRKGIANSKEERYSIESSVSVTTDQSFLGRIFKFGTIKIFNPALGHDIVLRDIPKPEYYAELLRRAKDAQGGVFMLNPRK